MKLTFANQLLNINMNTKRITLGMLVLFCIVNTATAQVNVDGRRNVVTSAVPFLSITPDSRSGAMGDVGVAISPDANSIHWNPAKLAYMEKPFGMSISYTPWLKNLVPDINLSYLTGYYKIDKFSGFGGSLRYFTLGDIAFTDENNQSLGNFSPNEIALDGAYARKLSDNFSIGVALRFIYSNLSGQIPTPGGGETKPGTAFAGDVSGYYTKKNVTVKNYKADWAFGFNISNIGSKISYVKDIDADFIPTNLKVGGSFTLKIDDANELTIAADLNKLLIPTLPYVATNSTGEPEIILGMSPDVGPVQGIVQSFYDAPGGFNEEIKEINPSVALEYWYSKTFALRTGYFYEHATKGNRKYITAGVGLKYNTLSFDFSYLIDAARNTVGTSPLANTVRFSLLFNFNENKKETTK